MKRFAFYCVLTGLCWVNGIADVIKGIQIEGNVNIEVNALLNELPVKVGDEYDTDTANRILKRLHDTLYFDDVVVEIRGGVVFIRVVENPIINRIDYEGMKFSTRDSLKDIIKLKPRQFLSKAVIQDTQQLILECYRQQGYLGAHITPKIVRRQNNRVDVIFEVKEGSPTYVKKVAIIGNKAVSSADLREMLSIKEKKIFHLSSLGGTKNKIYEPEKFVEDQETLIRYYLSLGYADFELVSATAELSPDKRDFFLTYYINEGDLYNFGKVTVDSKIERLEGTLLQSVLVAVEGQRFNGELVELSADLVRNLARTQGHNFASVEPVLKKHTDNKTVDITFVVVEGPKILIERIDIAGNRLTRDGVIRRHLNFYEGDVFDQKRLKQGESVLKECSFFKGVRIEPKDGSEPGKVIVTVNVDEEKTGSFFGNIAYSTLDGVMGEVKVSNNNFAGKAQQLSFNVSFNKNTFEGTVELSDPYFMNRNLLGSIELFHTRTKRAANKFVRNHFGIAPGIGYKISRSVSQYWNYRLSRDGVKSILTDTEKSLQSKANADNKVALEAWLNTDEGKDHAAFISSHYPDEVTVGSTITHTIGYDVRDRRYFPSKGFQVSWSTRLPLFSSTKVMVNTFSGSLHRKIYHDVVLNLRGSFSFVSALWGYKLRLPDGLFIGGDTLRGFDFNGISPLRGLCVPRRKKAFDGLVEISGKDSFKNYVSDPVKNKELLEKNKEAWEKAALGEKDSLKFAAELTVLTAKNEPHARQLSELNMIRGKHLGGTYSWTGSVELTGPVPGVSRDAELFWTMFFDMGSCWRTSSVDKDDKTSVENDGHRARMSAGFCLGWNSPFGMLNLGYAWPLRKSSGDLLQKLLFGYGMKFN
ncbi:MAG: outer membrane protein assembly factor BamA [Holosporales bacterium]|nr:outer membrane protein assembly factor BamA [Holosporales bacterium]